MGSFIRCIKSKSPDIQIDLFNINYYLKTDYPPSARFWSNIYSPEFTFPSVFYKIPKVRSLARLCDTILGIKKLAKQLKKRGLKYNIVQISFLLEFYSFCVDELKEMGDKMVLMPWGSDVLRAKKRKLNRIIKLVRRADYVTCGRHAPRFRQQIMNLLNVPEEKMVAAGFGTEMIDLINLHPELTLDNAKKRVGLDGHYVIVCGYNASPFQQHLKIIEAIGKIKGLLPQNMILLFPMTYGRNEKYIKAVIDKLNTLHLPYRMLNDYLSNEDLLYYRRCADLFIHAQTTDANSGTVAEYLLCDTKVINGAWLSYPQREKYGMPYYTFHSFDELEKVILVAIAAPTSIIPSELKKDILKEGWNNIGEQWVDFYHSCKEIIDSKKRPCLRNSSIDMDSLS